ncbi:hypothetical protein K7432_011784 [Basidiobolus ranarum]|uniref:Cytosolic endo-beta-N-acetylglucosaminidase TIM barrel domain-containing protein n=1 Tax=Basidiobolus ranarum TaxID=34480 RepID=A0ABR2VTB1_9FUNG
MTESTPKSRPFSSLSELDEWDSTKDNFWQTFAKPVPLATRIERNKLEREEFTDNWNKISGKVLMCHDMAGGYNEDAAVQGEALENKYNLQYWQYLDMFVYFSHNRVTIPPVTWINAAHKNGVPVLGTFITEWEEGSRETIKLLENVEFYANQLANIAECYGFDGWLLNIENVFSNLEEDTVHMINFIRILTEQMHKKIPHSKVIWYDSVTVEGLLAWQNRLNLLNFPFFEVCDGIFLNYTWGRQYPKVSCIKAGENRKFDVFAGIDVHGRNTYGGGMFDTYKALHVIADASISAAIFAPAWTYENFQGRNFVDNESKFWHGNGFNHHCVSQFVKPHIAPGDTRFVTNFDQGVGTQFAIHGKPVHKGNWLNFSQQSVTPTYRSWATEVLSSAPLILNSSVTSETSFYGGSSYRLEVETIPQDFVDDAATLFPIFDTNILTSDCTVLSFVYDHEQILNNKMELNLLLRIRLEDDRYVFLSPSGEAVASKLFESNSPAAPMYVKEIPGTNWSVAVFDLGKFDGCRVTQIDGIIIIKGLTLVPDTTVHQFHIGEIKIYPEHQLRNLEKTDPTSLLDRLFYIPKLTEPLNLKSSDITVKGPLFGGIDPKPDYQIILTISWDSSEFSMFNIYVVTQESRKYLGTSFCNFYRVDLKASSIGVKLDEATREQIGFPLTFQVQPVNNLYQVTNFEVSPLLDVFADLPASTC